MWLIVRTGERRGESAKLGEQPFVVGRDEACDLVVPDPKVSRRHVELAIGADGAVALRDLDSANGTFVDGDRVESAVLGGGEQIQIGSTVLTVADEPEEVGAGATVRGLSTVGALLGRGQSVVQRLALQRAVRRSTILAVAAIVIAMAVAALFAVGILPPGNEDRVERVVERASPSIVLVEKHHAGRRVGTGSGWVLDGQRRLIVTNAHVLNGGTSFQVVVDNELRPAHVVGVAPCDDLAVLRADGSSQLRTLPLGDQSRLRRGQTVIALGYPENASLEADLTSTTGVVSVVRTAYREPAPAVPRFTNVIQTDAALNPGNSGGPLLDLEGRLVGVNAAGRTLSGGRIIQGQSYAIGVDRVKEVVRVLSSGRSLAWSGIGLVYPTDADLRARGVDAGLVAGPAVPGTGAAEAGLGPPAALIVAVNGRRVGNSLASYCDAMAGVESGAEVEFEIIRPGTNRRAVVRVRTE